MNRFSFLKDKDLLVSRSILILTCSATLFLHQNCGGFISSDFSGDHSSSLIGDSDRASYDVRLGDRTYVASVLASVFFPEGEEDPLNAERLNTAKQLHEYISSSFTSEDKNIADIIKENILENVDEFKGPCSIYERDETCSGEDIVDVEIDVMGRGSVSREGIRQSVCYQILDQDRSIENVKEKINASYSLDEINSEKLNEIYNLFYPGVIIDQSSKEELEGLVNETLTITESDNEAWRMALLAVCQTGAWQIP